MSFFGAIGGALDSVVSGVGHAVGDAVNDVADAFDSDNDSDNNSSTSYVTTAPSATVTSSVKIGSSTDLSALTKILNEINGNLDPAEKQLVMTYLANNLNHSQSYQA